MVQTSFGSRIPQQQTGLASPQAIAELEAWMSSNPAPANQGMPSAPRQRVGANYAGSQSELMNAVSVANANRQNPGLANQGETGGNLLPGGGLSGIPPGVAAGNLQQQNLQQDPQSSLTGGKYIVGDAENPGLNFTDIQTFFQNPKSYLNRVLELDGMDTMGAQAGMNSLLEPYAQNIWHLAQLGLGGNSLMPDGAPVLDWAGNEMASWTQPGTFYDLNSMMSQIAGAKEGSNLGAYLTIDTPAGQVQNTEGLIAAAANMSMNPMMRNAAMSYISRLGDKFIGQGGATAGLEPYYQYLAKAGVFSGGLAGNGGPATNG